MVTKTAEVLTIDLGKPQSNGNGFSLRLTTGRSEKQSTLRIRHPPGLCSPKLLIEKRKIGYQFEAWWFFREIISLYPFIINNGQQRQLEANEEGVFSVGKEKSQPTTATTTAVIRRTHLLARYPMF